MHWNRVLRNIFSGWTSYVVTAIVGFLLTPIVVQSLGTTGYGLWTLVLSVTGYFGLLDLGIRSTVTRFLARHLALNDDENVNRTVSTAFLLLVGGGLLAFIATLVIAVFFVDWFRIEPQYATQGQIALLITGFNISVLLPLGIFSAVLYGLERYDVVSGVTVVAEVTRAALLFWLLRHGYGLVALALLAFAITVLQYSVMAIVARRLRPNLRIARRYVNRSIGEELSRFSAYRFIAIVANQLIFYSDAVVIGIFLGAGSITPFAIAVSLINYGRQCVFLALDPIYPLAARLDAKGDLAELRRLLIVGTRMGLLVALPLCLGFLFLGRQFITLWMGASYSDSAVLLSVLTVGQLASMPQYISTLVLTGMARHRPFAYMALAEGLANVVLSILLVRKLGLIGVAWGSVIPALIIHLVVVPLYTLRVVHLGLREYLIKAYLRPILCTLPIVVLGYRLSTVHASSWWMFAGEAFAMCGLYGVLSYFVCLDASQRAWAAGKLGVLFQRVAIAHES